MLNMKKGLALVLAAVTAFTFAPVANLGNSINAQAGDFLNVNGETVNIQKGETRWIALNDLSKLDWMSDKAENLAVQVSDTKIIKATLGNKTDSKSVSSSAAASQEVTTADIVDQNVNLGDSPRLWIYGKEQGTATVTLRLLNSSGQPIGQAETLTVNVAATTANISFEKTKVEFTKIANNGDENDYVVKDSSNHTYSANITLFNAKDALDGIAVAGDSTKFKAKSSNEKVVQIKGDKDKTYTYSGNKSNYTFPEIVPKGVGTATIDVDAVYKVNGVESVLVSQSFTVVVSDGTDTLNVKYDPNRSGSNQNLSLTATPDLKAGKARDINSTDDGYLYVNQVPTSGAVSAPANDEDVTSLYKVSKSTLYFDTISNKTAKLNISDSMGRAVTVTSNVDWVAVDNAGNVTVSNPTNSSVYAGQGPVTSAYITVSVAKVVISGKTLPELTLRIPVTVNAKDTTTLQVREASTNKNLGKTVGGYAGDLNTSWASLPRLYLSTKDKKTSDLKFITNTSDDARFITGAAYNNTDTSKASDAVTYSNGTLTAVKAGKAYVQIICRNSADTQGSAVVTFAVEVVNKNANNLITTAADTYNLTKTNPTANIGAKTTYATALKYEIVDKEGDDAKVVPSSDISVDANGNLTYSTSNQGSVIVRITGNETGTALAPEAKYVTVKYTSAKVSNDLKVDTTKLELKPGESGAIKATASTGSAISFKSSDEDVATVDANGNVTAKATGAAFITVDAAETDSVTAGQQIVTVLVSQGDKPEVVYTKPAKVKGVKVSNKKGAKVSLKFSKVKSNVKVVYKVQKQVRKNSKAKWSKVTSKQIVKTSTTLSVKKGYQVRTRVKAFYYADGKLYAGKYSKWVTKKTDKK